jgi:hypothetical protein
MIVLPVKPRKSIGWHYTHGLEGPSDTAPKLGNAFLEYTRSDHYLSTHHSAESAFGEHDSDDGLRQLRKLG